MPLVYLGTGWFSGIALASSLHLPLEFLPLVFLVPIAGLVLWRHDRRARLIGGIVIAAVLGAFWFTAYWAMIKATPSWTLSTAFAIARTW